MKSNLLLAVALIAVIGIVGGFYAFGGFNGFAPSGMEPVGPLSGSIGALPTNLTLSISPCSTPDATRYIQCTLSGYLRDQANNPIANRTIQFTTISCDPEGRCAQMIEHDDVAKTKADGSYSRVKSEPRNVPWDPNASVRIRAQFYGDSAYAGSSADAQKVC
jgi:hypothetical protein